MKCDSSLILRRVHMHIRCCVFCLFFFFVPSFVPFPLGVCCLYLSLTCLVLTLFFSSHFKRKVGRGGKGRMSYPRNCWWCFFSLSFTFFLFALHFLFLVPLNATLLCVSSSLTLSLSDLSLLFLSLESVRVLLVYHIHIILLPSFNSSSSHSLIPFFPGLFLLEYVL